MSVFADASVCIELRNRNGTKTQTIPLRGDNLVVRDVFVALLETEWARELFKSNEKNHVEMVPGYLVVLDGRMIQPWEVQDVPVSDGQTLKLVQVVAGG